MSTYVSGSGSMGIVLKLQSTLQQLYLAPGAKALNLSSDNRRRALISISAFPN